jgi:hypothetical protein
MNGVDRDTWVRLGAGAGAVGVSLYVIGALVLPREPDFDASAATVAAFFDSNRTRVQLGVAIEALWAPLFVWFLATVLSLARAEGERPGRAAAVALGCGLVFITLFLADVTCLAIGALRPENMLAAPEVAGALRDFSWLVMGVATPTVCGLAVALSLIALRNRALWPPWVGWLGLLAAAAYAMRIGTLFTMSGPFAADGLLGLWIPVVAVAIWLGAASIELARRAPSRNPGVVR